MWRATDEGGATVALKLLHPSLAHTDAARRRLLRETRLVNSVKGDGVARVLDIEIDAFSPFVVTELIEGPTLEASVKGEGTENQGKGDPFDAEELAALAANLAGIIDRIHSAGIAHRDLKPSNIILSDDGPVLIDFGIAQGEGDARLTTTGGLQGTPGYVSPELLRASDPDAENWKRGDWFGWAAVLCFAATGRHPFGSGNTEAVLHRVFTGEVDVEGLPLRLGAIFARALGPDSGNRPTPEELIAELDSNPWDEGNQTTLLTGGGEPFGETQVLGSQPTQVPDLTLPVSIPAHWRTPSTPAAQVSPKSPDRAYLPWHTPGTRPAQADQFPISGPQTQPSYRGQPSFQDSIPQSSYEGTADPGLSGAEFSWLQNMQYRHPRPKSAPLLSALLLGVFAWVGALAGSGWLALPLVLLLVGAMAGRVEEGIAQRRETHGGPRPSDPTVAAAASPWYLLLSVATLVPGIAAGVLAFLLSGSVGEVIVQAAARTPVDGLSFWRWASGALESQRPDLLVLGVATWLGVIVAWAVPWSQWARMGLSRWFTFAAPGRIARGIWGLGMLALVLVLMSVAVVGGPR